MTTPEQSPTPEILSVEAEQEILWDRVVARLAAAILSGLRPELTVGDDAYAIAATAVTGVLRHLRVMSGRQVAVLLAAEANRHETWVISEPPHYPEGLAYSPDSL